MYSSKLNASNVWRSMRRMVLTRLIWFAVGLIAGVILTISITADSHIGGLAKDGCHTEKATGQRHWPNTKVPKGRCETIDGATYKYFNDPELIENLRIAREAESSLVKRLDTERRNTRVTLREATEAYNRAKQGFKVANIEISELKSYVSSLEKGEPVCVSEAIRLEVELDSDRYFGRSDEIAAGYKLLECLARGN